MAHENRAERTERYGEAPAVLTKALEKYPREMWGYKSPVEDWSIHEVVVHITDSEANSFVRCRRIIAEPGKDVMAYDESGWARALNYSTQSPTDAADLFQLLRLNTYKLIKTLPEAIWSNTVYHPENGNMTLDDWLHVYENHVLEHVEQMDRIYEEWQAAKA